MLCSIHVIAGTCVDFSGSYKLQSEYSDEPVALKIEQIKCDSIILNYTDNNIVSVDAYELNGQKVKHAEYPEIGLVSYVTPYFKGNDIRIDVENRWNDGKSDKYIRRFHLEFGNNTILLDQRGDYRNDGVFVPQVQTVYVKI